MALFEVRGLACQRAGRIVFEQLEFALEPGDALVLRGPNGSGKSSLLRLLAGLLRPAAGVLSWQGRTFSTHDPEHRARLHFVGHLDAGKANLTVRENLCFIAGLLGVGELRQEALESFDLVDLADTPARYLSAGQKRRLALARLAVAPRPLWLLDEPAVGLDTANRRHLERRIAAHLEGGGLCIVATHGDVSLPQALVLDFGEAVA